VSVFVNMSCGDGMMNEFNLSVKLAGIQWVTNLTTPAQSY